MSSALREIHRPRLYIPLPDAGPPPDPPGPTPPIAGYIAHYDPSDLDTLTFSGGGVTAMQDKVGSFNATKAGTAITVVPMPGEELPALLFPGGGYFTAGVSMSDVTASGFCVAHLGDVGNATLLGPNSTGGILFRHTTALDLRVTCQNVAEIATMATPEPRLGVPTVYGYVITASDCTLYQNLASETDAHAQTLTGSRTLVIGNSTGTGTGGFLRGLMGEVVMYGTALSAGDAEDTIEYLMAKWGVS